MHTLFTLAAFFFILVYLGVNVFEERANCMQILEEVSECFKTIHQQNVRRFALGRCAHGHHSVVLADRQHLEESRLGRSVQHENRLDFRQDHQGRFRATDDRSDFG